MSSGYNDRLKPIAWKGECGDKETEEPRHKWSKKALELVEWMKSSTHTVAFTGAGISTASGIPDFRGPKGVWTLEKKGGKVECDIPFDQAQPSFTHMALVALMQQGYLHYVVSQNVDGLHIKSGIPRDRLSELHGNIFAEHCDRCNTEYIRTFDVHGMGCKPTGRLCDNPLCAHPLRDKTIDWDSPLPELEFSRAIDAHKRADLAICLGTSLRIRPAGNMPLRTLRKHAKPAPGKLVIVNLQKTHLDRSASMRFHVRTDQLMREVCRLLGVQVNHHDPVTAAAEAEAQSACEAAIAQAAEKPKPVKVKREPKIPTSASIGRPTRINTERLRGLYNPAIKPEETLFPYQIAEAANRAAAAAAATTSTTTSATTTTTTTTTTTMHQITSANPISVKRELMDDDEEDEMKVDQDADGERLESADETAEDKSNFSFAASAAASTSATPTLHSSNQSQPSLAVHPSLSIESPTPALSQSKNKRRFPQPTNDENENEYEVVTVNDQTNQISDQQPNKRTKRG